MAILVAVCSGILLLGYVTSADQRAMAGMRTRKVFVVVTPVPQGTAGDNLGDSVALKELPAKAIVPGALADTAVVKGKVSTTTLQVGEQLLASRFAAPAAAKAETTQVPTGFSEISILLDPERAVGSDLTAGDRVDVFVSLGDDADSGRTHLTLHEILVTRVQGVTADQAALSTGDSGDQTGQPSRKSSQPVPQGSLMVTMAVSANDAEQVVFASEYGHIWLSLDNKNSTDSNARVVTGKNAQQ
ncbi:Flp pilus assembly protein CpaB [Microlunatus sp. Gsoil 973]|uniref:Flp pilus assembly protein CpaB n=1 Tax=Microlunatus sp. Gsoil 973 TaxID=2672569 RepID=UPI0018A80ADA|nr:Flp pilus assembly protein CpaB [Microlunatus sp. Gsoil 973]